MTYTEARFKVCSPEYLDWLYHYLDEHLLVDDKNKGIGENAINISILTHFHAWLQQQSQNSYGDLYVEDQFSSTSNFFFIYDSYFRISSTFGAESFVFCEKLKYPPKNRCVYICATEDERKN